MWKDIKGYEGVYQVSDEGEIKRFFKTGREKIIKGTLTSGYPSICLSVDNQQKAFYIHRLVAEAFIDKPRTDIPLEVNHKDGNRQNNKVENLEWVTLRENQLHAMGELNHHLWGKPAKRVKRIDPQTGEVLAEYASLADAARYVGKMSAKQLITDTCKGYKNTAYGYRWEYAD